MRHIGALFPNQGSNPSPALQGRFLMTRPLGKSLYFTYRREFWQASDQSFWLSGLLETTLNWLISVPSWSFSLNSGMHMSYQGNQSPLTDHRTPSMQWVGHLNWQLSEPQNHEFGEPSIPLSRGNDMYQIRFKQLPRTQVNCKNRCLSLAVCLLFSHLLHTYILTKNYLDQLMEEKEIQAWITNDCP